MAEISAKTVMQLRQMTGAGMMDCKKALVQADGDIDAAVEILRKSGIAKAAKKIDRESKEGRIEAAVSPDRKTGAMIMLSSETDFVAKNEEFIELAKKLAELALQNPVNSTDELMTLNVNDSTVGDTITELIAKIGENIKPKKITRFTAEDNGIIYNYIHPGNKIGVMVEIESDSPDVSQNEKVIELAKEISMQIAFSKPVAISSDEVPKDVIEKEKKLYEEQAKEQGKPEKAIEKIVEGRLRKFLEESCLLNQEYIRDGDLTIEQLIKKVADEISADIRIKNFARFEVGVS